MGLCNVTDSVTPDAIRRTIETLRRLLSVEHNDERAREVELWQREWASCEGRIVFVPTSPLSPAHPHALIRDDDGVFSIGVAPRTGAPWPLSGARRISEDDVARINGRVWKFFEVMPWMTPFWSTSYLLDICLLTTELERRRIEIDAVIGQKAPELSAHLLIDTEVSSRWLLERGLTPHAVRQWLEFETRVHALRQLLRQDQVDAVAAHKGVAMWHTCVFSALHRSRAAQFQGLAKASPNIRQTILSFDLEIGETLTISANADEAPIEPAGVFESTTDDDEVVKVTVVWRDEMPMRRDDPLSAWLEEARGRAEVEWYWGVATKAC